MHLTAADVVAQAETQQAKIILHLRLKQHLFQRRYLLVAARENQPDARRQVALHDELKLRRVLVLAFGVVNQLQPVDAGLLQDMTRQTRKWLSFFGFEFNDRVVRCYQARLSDRLVEVHGVFQLRAGHGGEASNVFLFAWLAAGIFGECQFGVGTFQCGMLVDLHLKCLRFAAVKFHPVLHWLVHLGQYRAEDRVA